ncbi:DUF3343 domain-containing protein [Oceanivirga salmonicida]|uniref:DUF3343 domain-containing protein n=1 Tax=Oceanivirga salmonicida TaxID=1769291 RepID=UPI0008346835|nr:DUF3343 domain-containing protein [Oceanivirga salmonicida]
MIEEALIVFYNTHDSIKADNICLLQNIKASLVPTHPSISLGCGFMLKTEWNNLNQLIEMLDKENIEYKALYYSKKIGIKRDIKLMYENDNLYENL